MGPMGRGFGGIRPYRSYRPIMPVPMVVPIPYYPPVVPITVPVRPLTSVSVHGVVDFAQVLGQLNYLMEQARGNAAVDNQDIVALSAAIDRAQQSDADGLVTALRGMSGQLIEQARQLGMTYLVQLATLA